MKLWLRRTIGILLLLLMLVPITYCALRTYAVVDYNLMMKNAFEREKIADHRSPYLQGMTMEELTATDGVSGRTYIQNYIRLEGLRLESDFTFFDRSAYTLEENAYTEDGDLVVTLRTSLHYYDSPQTEEPVLTLEKGTQVVLENRILTAAEGPATALYGLTHIPTYEKGWRYTRPLLEEEEGRTLSRESVEALPFYYVRTEEIDRVEYYVWEDLWNVKTTEDNPNGSYWKFVQNSHLAGQQATFFETLVYQFYDLTVRSRLNVRDYSLLTEGIYLSPDMSLPLFGGLMWPMLGAAVLCLAGGVLLVRKPKKKTALQGNTA